MDRSSRKALAKGEPGRVARFRWLPCTAFCLILVTATACTVSHRAAMEAYESAAICCSDASRFEYQPLPVSEPVAFDIDADAKAFAFDSGKSYFKAFKLPDLNPPYTVQVRSCAIGERIDRAYVFYPRLLLLDESFSLVEDFVPEVPVHKVSHADAIRENKWGLPARLETGIQVRTTTPRYLVVATTPKLLETSSPYLEVSPFGFLGIVPQGLFQINHSPFGRVVLEVTP